MPPFSALLLGWMHPASDGAGAGPNDREASACASGSAFGAPGCDRIRFRVRPRLRKPIQGSECLAERVLSRVFRQCIVSPGETPGDSNRVIPSGVHESCKSLGPRVFRTGIETNKCGCQGIASYLLD